MGMMMASVLEANESESILHDHGITTVLVTDGPRRGDAAVEYHAPSGQTVFTGTLFTTDDLLALLASGNNE